MRRGFREPSTRRPRIPGFGGVLEALGFGGLGGLGLGGLGFRGLRVEGWGV